MADITPRYLDLERWPRRGAFDFFRGFDSPFFNLCTELETGPLVDACRAAPGTSFFLAYTYLSLRAANEVEPFRYRLEGERVRIHERIHGGTTLLLEDERFVFAYFDYVESFAAFHAAARAAIDQVKSGDKDFEPRDDRNDLIHYSTLPWVAFTSFSHARRRGTGDSVPKIVFGKSHERGGRHLLPISVEVHHALMDGLHVGRYLETLQRYFLRPEEGLRP